MSGTASIVFGIFAMLGFGVGDAVAKTILSSGNAIRIAIISQAMGTILFLMVALSVDRFVAAAFIISLDIIYRIAL